MSDLVGCFIHFHLLLCVNSEGSSEVCGCTGWHKPSVVVFIKSNNISAVDLVKRCCVKAQL